jgi:hypothetical protein
MLTPIEKAQRIHNDFGTFEEGQLVYGEINHRGAIAEIGAGQEVARTFFEALGTSNTIIKTMSAYGKSCSDAIYGNVPGGQPYISAARLKQMIDHDYNLLVMRSLRDDEAPKDGRELRYFAFANTVDTNEHGWAGVRVQMDGNSMKYDSHHALEFQMHFNCVGGDKQSKMRVVGALGINLIYAALEYVGGNTDQAYFVTSLIGGIDISDLRIDAISVEKLTVDVTEDLKVQHKVRTYNVEQTIFEHTSQAFGIELVKNSLVHCAAFRRPSQAAIGGYYAFDYIDRKVTGNKSDPKPLLLTRASCDEESLKIARQIIPLAKRVFARDISAECKIMIPVDEIDAAIQIPILSVSDRAGALKIYIDRDQEPKEHRRERLDALRTCDSTELAARINKVTEEGNVALLTEFLNTSELVKFLRKWTRLKPNPKRSPLFAESENIAFVFRTDQFIELLMNIHERVVDRDVLELTGSVIRRKTRMYIYPCPYNILLESNTRYGTPLSTAFRYPGYSGSSEDMGPNVASLCRELEPKYTSLIEYYLSRKMIKDLPPVATA